jgi:cytochrome c oxidase subunit 3
MAVVDVAIEHAPAAWRARANRLGLWLFIASESFLFSAAIASRYYLVGLERPEDLNQPLGLAITAVLLTSSLSAYRAEAAIAHDDRPTFLRATALTIALGLAFVVGVALEWDEGLRHFPPSTAYGTVFFLLIGLHAFHVVTGLVVLGVIGNLGRLGRFSAADHWWVEAGVKYWHFVDVAWVFIFPTLYLVR